MIYPEDVIEHTLNHGGKSAMEKFSLTEQQVIDIVRPFCDEIDGTDGNCPCYRNVKYIVGSAFMGCFMCLGDQRRI